MRARIRIVRTTPRIATPLRYRGRPGSSSSRTGLAINWVETGDQRRPYRAWPCPELSFDTLPGGWEPARMRIPPLGPRGEGWTIIQVALMFAIIVAGVAGPAWPMDASSLRRGAGILIAIGGVAMLAGGMVGLRPPL